jgi:cell fate regulator YaaT (PSP1 superfamily)
MSSPAAPSVAWPPAADGLLATGVRFRPTSRITYYAPAGFELSTGQWVIVEGAKGLECGRVVIAPKAVAPSELPSDELKPVLRLASEDDLRHMLSYKAQEKEALRRCAERIEYHGLPMRLAEAEYAFDGSRLTFYFTAEQRVDFRMLVRDLASLFHTRIELRQIGARDHAKLLGGVGVCGKTLCCSSWLTEFNVVSIKMAKEQGLPLNTNKISGVCGRLMCCLAYENDDYIAAKAEMPGLGEILMTPSGAGRVIGLNIPRESVDLMLESGAIITQPVKELPGYDKPPTPRPTHNGEGCGKPNCGRNKHRMPTPPGEHAETQSDLPGILS